MRNERIKIIDYIYGTMASVEKKEFEAEMKKSPDLQKQVDALKNARESISKWKITESPKRHVNPAAVLSEIRKKGNTRRFDIPVWAKVAFAGGSMVMLFALLNLKIAVSDNGLSISFGAFEKRKPVTASEKIDNKIDENNRELLNIVKAYIADRDEKQLVAIAKIIRDSEIQAVERRKSDLRDIYSELANMKLNTNNYFSNANAAIQGLFQYVSDIHPERSDNASTGKGI